MRLIFLILLAIPVVIFAADPYKKVYKSVAKLEKLEAKRKYLKAMDLSEKILSNPFATIKDEDKVTNFLNHAELSALIYKQTHEVKILLDSALSPAQNISGDVYQQTLLEASKIALLGLDYIQASEYLNEISSDELMQTDDYKVTKARILSKLGFYKSALDLIKTTDLSDFDRLFLLQLIATEYGDHKLAKTTLGQLRQKSAESEDKRHLGMAHYTAGLYYDQSDQLLLSNGELEESIKFLSKADEIKPRNIFIHLADVMDYNTLSSWQIKAKDKIKTTKDYLKFLHKTYGSQSAYEEAGAITEAKAAIIGYAYNNAIDLLYENHDNVLALDNPVIGREFFDLLILASVSINDFEMLDSLYQQQLQYSERCYGTSSPNYQSSLLEYSIYLSDYKNQPLEALKAFEKGYDNLIQEEWHITQNENQYYRDQYEKLLLEIGYNQKALKLAQESLAMLEKQYGEKSLFYGKKLERIAEIQIHQTHVKSALETIDNVYKIYQYNNVIGYDLAYLNKILCSAWSIQGDYGNALKLLKKAQREMRSADEDYNDKDDLFSFAQIYLHQGKYKKVNDALQDQIEFVTSTYGANDKRIINLKSQAASFLLLTGQLSSAEKYANEALVVADSIYGKLPPYAHVLKILADINLEKGDHEIAQKQYEESLSIMKEFYGSGHLDIALIKEKQALIKFNYSQDKSETEELFKKAITTTEYNIGNTSPHYAQSLIQLANFYIETGQLTQANNTLNQLDAILKSSDVRKKHDINNAELLYTKGKLAYAQNQFGEAEQYFNKCARQTKELFSTEHPMYRKALSQLARAQYSNKDLAKAIKSAQELTEEHTEFITTFFNSLSEREKTKYWNTVKSDFEFYNAIAFEYAATDPTVLEDIYNTTLATKALLLNNSIKVRENILNSGDDELIDDFDKLIAMKEELLAINSMSAEDKSHLDKPLDRFQKDIIQLEKRVNEQAGNYNHDRKYNWGDVKNALGKNEYAIELIRYRRFNKTFTDSIAYAALILDSEKKSQIQFYVFENGRDMENRLFNYYKNTRTLLLKDELSYESFWQPLEKFVPRNSTVYLSPDGIYNLMNPETFEITPDNFVIDHFDIRQLTNTKELLSKEKISTTPTNSLTIIADPNFYPEQYSQYKGVSKLPGTSVESASIQAIANTQYKIDVLKEREAIEQKIKAIDNPTILHFATHGYFKPIEKKNSDSELNLIQDNSLLKSGLILTEGGQLFDQYYPEDYNQADGLLTAYEVLNMKLDNTDLVVLSACETGLGTGEIGEGVYGLQKAFLVAGANNVIMSIFKVSDEVTVEFMKTYYELLLQMNDKRAALLETKKRVRLAHPEPFFWGSFVMVGK